MLANRIPRLTTFFKADDLGAITLVPVPSSAAVKVRRQGEIVRGFGPTICPLDRHPCRRDDTADARPPLLDRRPSSPRCASTSSRRVRAWTPRADRHQIAPRLAPRAATVGAARAVATTRPMLDHSPRPMETQRDQHRRRGARARRGAPSCVRAAPALRAVALRRHHRARDRVGHRAHHDVELHPRVLRAELAVLLREPAVVDRRREPRRVDRVLAVLDRPQRRSRLLDERGQDRCRRRVGEEVVARVEVTDAAEVAARGALAENPRRRRSLARTASSQLGSRPAVVSAPRYL